MLMKRFLIVLIALLGTIALSAQDIPQNVQYTRIYDFIDELANENIIEVNSGIRPYSRAYIAQLLLEARSHYGWLNTRQQKDLDFFLQDYAVERDTLPTNTRIHDSNNQNWDVSLWQPAYHYFDDHFKFRATPIIGGEIWANENGAVTKRYWGAELQATLLNHVSIYASLRDNAYNGEWLSRPLTKNDARITRGGYFNLLPGAEYKEASYGGDFSDMRGGIKLYGKYGSVGIIRDNIVWGESFHSSNILSAHAPAFPMVTLNFKPVKWLELNYIHGWLVSNVLDSTSFFMQQTDPGIYEKMYRPADKYMAANMLTITPVSRLHLSLGNSIIYSEDAPIISYFIPFAFYKSLDHLTTKGLNAENQNSQVFFMFSSRNIRHLHLYGSLFIDEFQFSRLKDSNKESNPLSWQVGASLSNVPRNFYAVAEFTRSNIITYKHAVPPLTYTSNSYYLGHYLGDNSQEIYLKVGYRPIPRLDVNISYTNARHFNEYSYARETVGNTISQSAFDDLTWQCNKVRLSGLYELTNNVYLHAAVIYSSTKGYDRSNKTPALSESNLTAEHYLNLWTPRFMHGDLWTVEGGLNIGF